MKEQKTIILLLLCSISVSGSASSNACEGILDRLASSYLSNRFFPFEHTRIKGVQLWKSTPEDLQRALGKNEGTINLKGRHSGGTAYCYQFIDNGRPAWIIFSTHFQADYKLIGYATAAYDKERLRYAFERYKGLSCVGTLHKDIQTDSGIRLGLDRSQLLDILGKDFLPPYWSSKYPESRHFDIEAAYEPVTPPEGYCADAVKEKHHMSLSVYPSYDATGSIIELYIGMAVEWSGQ